MNRRLVYTAVGLLVGAVAVGLSALAAQAQAAREAGGEPGAGLGDGLRQFLAEVRELAAEREAELRAGLGLDGSHDLVDAGRTEVVL